jgi:hypothetical protein
MLTPDIADYPTWSAIQNRNEKNSRANLCATTCHSIFFVLVILLLNNLATFILSTLLTHPVCAHAFSTRRAGYQHGSRQHLMLAAIASLMP